MFDESLMAEIEFATDETLAERTLFSFVTDVECPTGAPDETFADDISIHLVKRYTFLP